MIWSKKKLRRNRRRSKSFSIHFYDLSISSTSSRVIKASSNLRLDGSSDASLSSFLRLSFLYSSIGIPFNSPSTCKITSDSSIAAKLHIINESLSLLLFFSNYFVPLPCSNLPDRMDKADSLGHSCVADLSDVTITAPCRQAETPRWSSGRPEQHVVLFFCIIRKRLSPIHTRRSTRQTVGHKPKARKLFTSALH